MVLKVRILDVAIDIRMGSPWYGEYIAVELSADGLKLLWIPTGFIHEFQALEDDTLVLYLVTKKYSREYKWPIEKDIVLSEKEGKYTPLNTPLKQAGTNFKYL